MFPSKSCPLPSKTWKLAGHVDHSLRKRKSSCIQTIFGFISKQNVLKVGTQGFLECPIDWLYVLLLRYDGKKRCYRWPLSWIYRKNLDKWAIFALIKLKYAFTQVHHQVILLSLGAILNFGQRNIEFFRIRKEERQTDSETLYNFNRFLKLLNSWEKNLH